MVDAGSHVNYLKKITPSLQARQLLHFYPHYYTVLTYAPRNNFDENAKLSITTPWTDELTIMWSCLSTAVHHLLDDSNRA